ncbi:thioesterase family protein [uncultured Roseibium sp.]|uniref:thioesterase family protein n=1 Tax=uncultured Roseibium sp. TaxID=1936171 RepID=UPI00263696E6|nr:thioesterase family protein [uncultured Roseibium sp.]
MVTFQLHEEPLQNNWLDAYGHLNEAYYLVPFSNATWKLQDHFGVGTDYFDKTGCALYTLETHLRYVGEVRAPATLKIETAILGVDAKRLHVGHTMLCDSRECATFECMLLHYDTKAERSAPFPNAARSALQDSILMPTPDWVGQALRRLV